MQTKMSTNAPEGVALKVGDTIHVILEGDTEQEVIIMGFAPEGIVGVAREGGKDVMIDYPESAPKACAEGELKARSEADERAKKEAETAVVPREKPLTQRFNIQKKDLPDSWDPKSYPILKTGNWLVDVEPDTLAKRLLNLMHEHRTRITEVQQYLLKAMPTGSPHALSEMFITLDENHYLMNSILSKSEALLDKAQQSLLLPTGSSAMCFDEATGTPISSNKTKWGDEDFIPKYKELTENDRKSRQDSDVAAFRLFRDEIRSLCEAMQNRMFNLKGIMRDHAA